MDILERLKIVAETTSEQWPTASIDFEYRAAVKEIETLRAALAYANAIPDLALKDLAEDNPPVAWVVPEFGFLFPTEDAAKRYLRNLGSIDKATPLYAKPSMPAVPEGWQLVPKEPTPEMAAAAVTAFPCSHIESYRAMLAAAPEYKEDK